MTNLSKEEKIAVEVLYGAVYKLSMMYKQTKEPSYTLQEAIDFAGYALNCGINCRAMAIVLANVEEAVKFLFNDDMFTFSGRPDKQNINKLSVLDYALINILAKGEDTKRKYVSW